jgi:CelD/BcsL family acetyltransferase involved in cellulose biosynthesis
VRWVYDEPNICPFVPLPGDWESFSKSLSHKKRKRQRSYFRKLNEEYPDQWEWRMVTSDSQIDETLTELVDLHQALWKSLGRLGSFHHPAIVSFHKTVAAQFLKSNYLRIYRLEIAGELAAVSLHYMFRGKAFYFSSGRRQDLAHLHIGHVLQEIAIRDALLSDAHEYDFLRGDEQYKLAWGAILRQDLTLLWPTTTRVRMEQWVISVIAVVWRQLKPAIPDRLQQLMKQRLRTNSVSQLMNG